MPVVLCGIYAVYLFMSYVRYNGSKVADFNFFITWSLSSNVSYLWTHIALGTRSCRCWAHKRGDMTKCCFFSTAVAGVSTILCAVTFNLYIVELSAQFVVLYDLMTLWLHKSKYILCTYNELILSRLRMFWTLRFTYTYLYFVKYNTITNWYCVLISVLCLPSYK